VDAPATPTHRVHRSLLCWEPNRRFVLQSYELQLWMRLLRQRIESIGRYCVGQLAVVLYDRRNSHHTKTYILKTMSACRRNANVRVLTTKPSATWDTV
jgi:hypothetical protein